LPHLSRDEKEKGARFHTTFVAIHAPRSQSHHAMDSSPPVTLPILPYAFSTTSIS
jgi:hypothetical protein